MSAQPSDSVSIIVGGQQFTGWQSVRISRSCEHMPSSFEIMATQRNPDNGTLALLMPGSPCVVMIGPDVVLTGYIDRFLPSIGPRAHQVQIQGRGRCEDLVDCSVTPNIINGMQITTSSLANLAERMCAPFGAPPPIIVTDLTGTGVPVAALNSGAPLVFNATLQETPYEILEKVARYAGVLIYENGEGQLVLANVGGEGTMASGFAQGVNVQNASAAFSMDQRYREYLPALMSTNMLGQEGVGGTEFPPAYDSGVPRFRQLIIVSEQFQWGQSYAETRAQWEAARRWGRSNVLRVTCDSWRDSAGRLWAPNAFATINIPALKLGSLPAPWIIASVDFLRDSERGTVADLTLMPKEAFTPEPEILVRWMFNPNDPGAVPSAGGGAQPGPAAPAAPGGAAPSVPPAGGGATPAN